jgi:hypothetical protein
MATSKVNPVKWEVEIQVTEFRITSREPREGKEEKRD